MCDFTLAGAASVAILKGRYSKNPPFWRAIMLRDKVRTSVRAEKRRWQERRW